MAATVFGLWYTVVVFDNATKPHTFCKRQSHGHGRACEEDGGS